MNARAKNLIAQGKWTEGWRMGPSVWNKDYDTSNRGKFRTLKAPGDIAPTEIPAAWSFHLGLTTAPIPFQCILLADGFQLSFTHNHKAVNISCVCVKKGVLLIEANAPLNPTLFTAEYDVHREDTAEWIELPWGSVVLVHNTSEDMVRYCLVEREQAYTASIRTARTHLDASPAHLLNQKIKMREQILGKHHIPEAHIPLVLHAMESLAGHLRPPLGSFTHRWSNADMDGHDRMDLNQVYPLVSAWCALDPTLALEIFKTALSCQHPSGFLPSLAMPDGHMDTRHAALPLFAQSALMLKKSLNDQDWIKPLLPKLRDYLSWAITYYDPQGDGNLTWRTSTEALIEETFDPEVLSADLYTLLLCEIEAMAQLDENEHNKPLNLLTAKDMIEQKLKHFFWDKKESCFPDRFRNGDPVERITLSAFVPLLWSELDRQYVNPMIQKLDKVNLLRRKQGIALWAEWEDDPEPAPIPSFHQLLMMHALLKGTNQAAARRLKQDLLKAMTVQYIDQSRMTDNLSDNTPNTHEEFSSSSSVPDTSALCINCTCLSSSDASDRRISRPLKWLDRHRKSILISVILILTISVTAITLAFVLKKKPPISSIKANAALAEQYYSEHNYAGAIPIYEELLKGGTATTIVRRRLGNAHLHNGNPVEAEKYYRSILAEGDSPVIIMNLALSLYRQGRAQEAAQQYRQVIEKYANERPDLVEKAQTARHLIAQELKKR